MSDEILLFLFMPLCFLAAIFALVSMNIMQHKILMNNKIMYKSALTKSKEKRDE